MSQVTGRSLRRVWLGATVIALLVALASPAGATATIARDDPACGTYSNSTPVDIPPPLPSLLPHAGGATGAVSTIDVTGASVPVDVVTVTIPQLDYPSLAHLRVSLVAPDATRVVLFDEGTISGTQLRGTVLDDSASTAVTDGAPPLTGPYRPAQPLAGLHAKGQNGRWSLVIDTDDVSLEGTLARGWQLNINCAPKTRAVVALSPEIVAPDQPVAVDASRSTSATPDPLARYEVDTGSGYVDGASVRTISSGAVGHKTIRLRVTDSGGGTDEIAAPLIVTNPPTAVIDPVTGNVDRGLPVELNAAHSFDGDPGGGIAKYQWADDGETFVDGDATHTVSFEHSGIYQVGLRVTDVDGATATTAATITVINQPPVANFDVMDPAPISGQPMGFDASSSTDPEHRISSYRWNFGDGTPEVESALSMVSHSFAAAQSVTVTLTVTDDEGAQSTTHTLVTLRSAPVAALTASANPVGVGVATTFSAAGSTGTGAATPITRYDWDLDGAGGFEETTTAPQASRSYPNPGRLTVRVRVTDQLGHSGTASLTLTIGGTAGSAPPGPGGGWSGSPQAPAPGGSSPAATADGSKGASHPALRASLSGAAIQRLQTVLKRGLVMSCRANQSARCVVRLELRVREARRLKLAGKKVKKPVVLARATKTTSGARAGRLVLRINRKAAGKLRRARRVTLVVVGKASSGAGKSAGLSRAVLVRAR